MSLRAKRSNPVPPVKPAPSGRRTVPAVALLAVTVLAGASPPMPQPLGRAASLPQHCMHPAVVLWGDGRHDDTAALNAWWRGENAIWGDSGAPVGATIAGHDFRLTGPVLVPAEAARTLRDFRMIWPARGETVSGGTIRALGDPKTQPVVSSVRIVGGDPGEGKPFDAPDLTPPHPLPDNDASCGIS